MSKTIYLSCIDFDEDYNCCSSCHEDESLGYDLAEIDVPKKHKNEFDLVAYVCCAFLQDDFLKDRDNWVNALNKYRKRRKQWL